MEHLVIAFLASLLSPAATIVAQADDADKRALIHKEAVRTAEVLNSEWLPDLPVVAISADKNAAEPLLISSLSGTLTVAAESRAGDARTIVLAQSRDGGRTWDSPREVARAGEGNRITAGAGGALPSGRLILALHEWSEKPGKVDWVREEPRGVHHYSWKGFQRESQLEVLTSDDEGKTWTKAACDLSRGPIAPSAMGSVFAAKGKLWMAVYGPADRVEMDAALSSAGLMRSDGDGLTWRFSHWVARADLKALTGYGPGGIVVMPDGTWLGMLQADLRGRGDYTKPRVCRIVSRNGGKTWSAPEIKMIGTATSLVVLDKDHVILGSESSGVTFNLFVDAGASLLYQDHLWRGGGARGGLRLAKGRDATVLCVYNWLTSQAEVRLQVLRSKASPEVDTSRPSRVAASGKPKWRWEMAEGYQVPDMAEAPAGLRMRTLMKLKSGDWMCIGSTGTIEAPGLSYGFGASGLAVMRAPAIEGPWNKVVDLPIPEEVGGIHDPGTGMGMPSFLWQHSSGRLFLPFSAKDRVDVFLTYSDDEGRTWNSLGSMTSTTGLPDVREADVMVEQKDGSIVLPMTTGAGWEPGVAAHPFYIRSADRGRTWSDPLFWARWATYPPTPYEGLPYVRAGDIRETALAIVSDKLWLGIYREMRGAPVPEDYIDFGQVNLTRSEDGGRTWKPSFGFIGCEPALAATPDGAIFCADRQLDHASVWISYNQGRTWQVQEDPAEVPWGRGAGQHGQWPPGGESTVRVLDEKTVVVITDTGLIPSGMTLPEGYKGTRELYGRAQVRFFRRAPATEK